MNSALPADRANARNDRKHRLNHAAIISRKLVRARSGRCVLIDGNARSNPRNSRQSIDPLRKVQMSGAGYSAEFTGFDIGDHFHIAGRDNAHNEAGIVEKWASAGSTGHAEVVEDEHALGWVGGVPHIPVLE